ncbi:NAD-dependent succinate-semialdehyde dehydrogenase [Kribbella sp. NPDC048915]|uniref:NAD-dependent succinate-semialdehyde dehydrogenase n=1 Tax=Kribbella sp. NPDC048915 TaxID=3155148 RepID=UPI00340571CA
MTLHPAVPQPVLGLLSSLAPEHGVRVGGERRSAAAGRTSRIVDPGTGTSVAEIADADEADALAAVDAAAAAFPAWAAMPPRRRSEVLRRAYELLVSRSETLAALISLENGKALPDARAEVRYAAEFFRWFSEEAVRPDGHYGPAPDGGARIVVTSRPVGVAALVTPWNFPAAMATRKLGPALAAGCTVVLKPAAETPLTALAVADILTEAGAPPGVVNVVPTTRPADVVSAWLSDQRVRKISFTGSTGVGRTLLAQAAARVVNSSMELGGNAPFVVAADADVDAAVAGALVAKFRNGGQACTAANRFYVHEKVLGNFTARFGQAIRSLKVGHAFDPGTEIGPVISLGAADRIGSLVDGALAEGATLADMAAAPRSGGSFVAPTLLTDVPGDASILRDEIFGPVAPIVSWASDEDLLEQVNASELGLAAYVYATDLAWALHLGERIEAGMVGVNRGVVSDPAAPFGGVKQSGLGREGAREGIREFCEVQYLSVDWE